MLVAVCACGSPHQGFAYPVNGLALVSLDSGTMRAASSLGSDLVAVTLSDDGSTAYVADNDPGDVYAVHLPDLKEKWKQHTDGAPFGLLLHNRRLLVTLYDNATIDELDPETGAILSTYPTVDHPAAMTVDAGGQLVIAGAGEYGTATVGGDVWMANYKQHELFDLTHPRGVALPLGLSPFWLSPGAGGALLVAAEGAQEDSDNGGVLSYDPMRNIFQTLASPRDPDQVVQSGSNVLVAAHGEHQVLAIGQRTSAWATGASAVALAPDPALGLLVVVLNAHE